MIKNFYRVSNDAYKIMLPPKNEDGTIKTISLSNKENIIDCACSFDIETYNGIMYIWQLHFNNINYYGRTWEEYTQTINHLVKVCKLSRNRRLKILVHNLSYEYEWLRTKHKVNTKKSFAKTPTQPIKYATLDGVDFIDTLALTNLPLKELPKTYGLPTEKLTEIMDYTETRTPLTELDENTLEYSKNDIQILAEFWNIYIQPLIVKNRKIPMTLTSIVIDEMKANIPNVEKYIFYNSLLQPRTYKEYLFTHQFLYQGGISHGYAPNTNKILYDVKSPDENSAYPFCMLAFPYPVAPFNKIAPKNAIKYFKNLDNPLKNDYRWIACLTFHNIYSKSYKTYISSSKCYSKEKATTENGRLLCAKSISVFVTDIDFAIIKRCYKWEYYTIDYVKVCTKLDYLPFFLVKCLLDNYEKKERLKAQGQDGTPQYKQAKQKVNLQYGISGKSAKFENVIFSDTKQLEKGEYTKDLEQQYIKWIRTNSIMTLYIGVYVTVYNRFRFMDLYLKGCELGVTVGGDTDSVKYIDNVEMNNYIKTINKETSELMQKACNRLNISMDIFGRLGQWEFEKDYKKFKFVRNKTYIGEYENGDIKIICCGLSKKGKDFIKKQENPLEYFNNNMTITESGKLIPKRYEDYTTMIDGQFFHEDSGIILEEVEFSLKLDRYYLGLVDWLLENGNNDDFYNDYE